MSTKIFPYHKTTKLTKYYVTVIRMIDQIKTKPTIMSTTKTIYYNNNK